MKLMCDSKQNAPSSDIMLKKFIHPAVSHTTADVISLAHIHNEY